MYTWPHSNFSWADSLQLVLQKICQIYKRAGENGIKWVSVCSCTIQYVKLFILTLENIGHHLNHLLPTTFCPVNIPFERPWCLCLHSCSGCSGCLGLAACWRAMLILLAIRCSVRQQNSEPTSSLYRCNSTGASIPLLDYREGVTMYANFTFNTPLPKQTYHPFQSLFVCLCVCVCVYV